MPNQSTYKLLYLNLRGFGEPIRLLLHYKNVEFEDVRFDRKEFLASAELKKRSFLKIPFQTLNVK